MGGGGGGGGGLKLDPLKISKKSIFDKQIFEI